jgi:peroxiredoxin Q/BCP
MILGVSLDSVDSHRDFAAKLEVPYALLADRGGKTARAFGVKRGIGPLSVASRKTFLIGKDHRIVKRWDKVDVYAHHNQVQVALAENGLLGESNIPVRGLRKKKK